MSKELNNLKPFFEDNYRRISVREYARIIKVSPATASKLLEQYNVEKLLNREQDRIYTYYYANRENALFVQLLRIYWLQIFNKIGLIGYLENEFANPVVILFGSFAKAEINPNSDVDIAIFTRSKKELVLGKFQKILKREIQTFIFKSINSVENKELLPNILNGFIISGSW
ncbi:TPA: nucleotidyltransferase domain-containing protein [Candidatus Woesearchaeota archaeon]|nr:nucleotidyltransferase domain-containing protein [Candidatus Woesearchaeota archaeon]